MPFKVAAGAKRIANHKGLEIFIVDNPAKKTGKDRIWIQVRQKDPKQWKVVASLSYHRAVDVQFEKESGK
jgi:hypothetical protein